MESSLIVLEDPCCFVGFEDEDSFDCCYEFDDLFIDFEGTTDNSQKNRKTKENLQKEKISLPALDAILSDDVEAFTEVINDEQLANQKLVIVSQKIPAILDNFPPLLSAAAFFGAKDICDYLISMNAKQDAYDEKLLSFAHFAAAGGDLSIFRDYVDTENYSNTDIQMNFPIHYAALMGRTDIVKYIWSKRSDFISVLGNSMKHPIHFASENGHVDVVDFLLSQNISVNETDEDNKTPLMYAASGGHLKLTVFLLSRKAGVNDKDEDGRTALVYAAQNGFLSIVKVLISHNATYKNNRMKYDPLVEASGSGHLDVVKYLISQGAYVNTTTHENVTPLQAAAENKRLNVLKYLIEKGASYIRSISSGYTRYKNILTFACLINYSELVKYLFDSKLFTPDEIPEDTVFSCIEEGLINILKVFDDYNIDLTFLIDKIKFKRRLISKSNSISCNVALFILKYLENHGKARFGDILELARALKSLRLTSFLLENTDIDFTVLKTNDEIMQRAKLCTDNVKANNIIIDFLCVNGKESTDENINRIINSFFSDNLEYSEVATALKGGIKLSIEIQQSIYFLMQSIINFDKEMFDNLIETGVDVNYCSSGSKHLITVCIRELSELIAYKYTKAPILFYMLNILLERGAKIAIDECPLKYIIDCKSYPVFDCIRKNTELTKEYIEKHELLHAAIKAKSIYYFDWFMSYYEVPYACNLYEYIDDIYYNSDDFGNHLFKTIINSSIVLKETQNLYSLLFRSQDIELFKQYTSKGAKLNTPMFYEALASNISSLTCKFFDGLLECGMMINHEIMQEMYKNTSIIKTAPRRSLLSYLIKKYDIDLTSNDILSGAIMSDKYAAALVLIQCGHKMNQHTFDRIFLNGDGSKTLYLFSKLLEYNYRCSDTFNNQSIPLFMIKSDSRAGFYLFTRYGYKIEAKLQPFADSFENAKYHLESSRCLHTPTVRIHSHLHSNKKEIHSPSKTNKK